MTTYGDTLHTLAMDPFAFDTELAAQHAALAKAQSALSSLIAKVYRAAHATRRSGYAWSMTYSQAHAQVRESHRELLAEVSAARHDIAEIQITIQAMDEAYTGWTRYFPSITKSHPHIHRSLTCRTLHVDTLMSWAPELSGHTDAEAVDKLDEALCSVCFPGAPVALHNYVSRRSQAEQAQRQAAKDERDAAKARKQLTPGEVFRTQHGNDRVTTVAECLRIIRQAVEQAVEVEYWATHTPEGWDAEQIARRRRNSAANLVDMEADAEVAAAVLMAREVNHGEGYGATADAIAKVRASKLKSARKEWAKI